MSWTYQDNERVGVDEHDLYETAVQDNEQVGVDEHDLNETAVQDDVHDDMLDYTPIASILPSMEEYDQVGRIGDETTTPYKFVEPHVGFEYDSAADAHKHYSLYASNAGFVCRIGQLYRSRLDGSIDLRKFVCSREGFQSKYRCGCSAFVRVSKNDVSGRWIVSSFVKEHNHEFDGSGNLKRKFSEIKIGSSIGDNKRGRGRPRIEQFDGDGRNLHKSVKKGRGRPRVRVVEDGVETSKNAVKKGRGRPKAKVVESGVGTSKIGDVKKGRGRQSIRRVEDDVDTLKNAKSVPGGQISKIQEKNVQVSKIDIKQKDGAGVGCEEDTDSEVFFNTLRRYITRGNVKGRKKVRDAKTQKMIESGMTGEGIHYFYFIFYYFL